MNPLQHHRREQRRLKHQEQMKREGKFIFMNVTNADLILPRPTASGQSRVGPRQQFVGDSYYKSMREVMCVQEIIEEKMPEKLITEQPPTFTEEGMVEFVEKKPEEKPLHEEKKEEKKKKSTPPARNVLLNEQPSEGIRIMR